MEDNKKYKAKPHTFKIDVTMDGRNVATRTFRVTEYNDNVIYSLPLNEMMKGFVDSITKLFKTRDISRIFYNREKHRY
jgi:hypothetical protein